MDINYFPSFKGVKGAAGLLLQALAQAWEERDGHATRGLGP